MSLLSTPMLKLATLTILLLLQASPTADFAALKTRAEAGDTKAQVDLGISYASGNGVTASDVEAVKWFRKAAERRDASGEYSLAEMYLTGRGVPTDLNEAAKWMRCAAEDGDRRGQFNLAVMYEQGQGVSRDQVEAAKWMREAANRGLAAGQFGLGSMYAHGRGVPQNEIEAAAWYRKAAGQGDVPAMNNLALLLATSTNPKIRNPKEAVSVAEQAVATAPNDATCLDTLGRAYFEAGQVAKAEETEQKALTLRPEDPTYKKALAKYRAAVRR